MMQFRTLMVVVGVFVAVTVASIVGVAYAVSAFNRPLSTHVNIVAGAGYSYYSDSAATVPLNSLELGDLVQGETKVFTFYIKNTSTAVEHLSSGPSTLPANIGTLTFTFDGDDEKDLNAGSISQVQGTLVVAASASAGSVDFTVSIDATPITGGGSPTATPALVSYSATIQPILNSSCTACHGSAAGVTLSSYSSTMQTVTAGNATGSLLYKSLVGNGVTKMPPGGSLSTAQIQSVANWINQGALNN